MSIYQITSSIADHFLIVFSLIVVYIQFLGLTKKTSKRFFSVLLGFSFGIIALLSTLFPLQIARGVQIDTKIIVVFIASYYGGIIPGIIPAVITIIARAMIGGMGAVTGIAGVIVSVVLGILIGRLNEQNKIKLNHHLLFLSFGLLMSANQILWDLLLPHDLMVEVLSKEVLPVLIIYLPSVYLIFKYIEFYKGRLFLKEQLVISEKNNKMLFESHRTPIVVMDLEILQIITCNKAAVEILGYTSIEDVIGKTPLDFSPRLQEDGVLSEEKALDYISQCKKNGEIRFDWIHQRPNGEIWYADIYLMLFIWDNKPSFQFTLTDITQKKQWERQLRESNLRYESLFEDSPISLWVEDFSKGKEYFDQLRSLGVNNFRDYFTNNTDAVFHCASLLKVVDVNQATLKLYKASSKEQLFAGIQKLLTPKSIEVFREQLILLAEGERVYDGEIEQLNLEGEIIYGLLHMSVAPGYEGTLGRVLLSVQDITKRKKAEDAVKHRVLALTQPLSVTDITMEDLFDIDELQNIQDAFSKATGVASIITSVSGEPITQPSNFTHFCDGIIRKTEKGFANCKQSDACLGKFNLNGPNIKPCLSSGLIDGGASIIVGGKHIANWLIGQVRNKKTDIWRIAEYAKEIGADENEAIDAFKDVPEMSEERFEKIASTLYILANELSIKAYQNIQQARFIAERKQIEDNLRENEMLLRQQNEEFLAVNEELSEANNRILAVNEQLLMAKEKAEESDRLKSAFLANMSHEIRTPMNAIVGFSNLLVTPDIEKEKALEFSQIIQVSCNQLLTVVNDILDISKIETGQMEIHKEIGSPYQTLTDSYNLYLAKASEKNLTFELKIGPNLEHLTFESDFIRLGQVVNNLVSNAIKFTHNGGITFGYLINVDEIVFYVRDTGIGIPLKSHSRIFERFHQIDNQYAKHQGGTGLGLAISKNLVGLLGGRIWMESAPGEGSTFWFALPFQRMQDYVIENTPKEFSTIHNWKGKTVLIAEDEKYNFLLMQEILDPFHMNILYAKDGKEAVEVYKANPDVDIVLMDIKMPVKNGYEAGKEIHQLNPNVPIIAITAYAMVNEIKESFRSGMVAHVSKPINREELIATMESFLN